MADQKPEKKIKFIDIVPFAFGTDTSGDNWSVIIEKNSEVPCRGTKSYMTSSDNQEFLNIDVLQGISKSRKECFKVATTKIEGLPRGPKGSQKITIVYEVDKNGVLNVTAFSTN